MASWLTGAWLARRRRRATGDAPSGLPADAPADTRLPAPLFDLRRRLMAAFNLSELADLAFAAGIASDSVPDDTRQMFALGLVRAAWCRGLLPALLAAAAREAPRADWAFDVAALPAPPAAGCEDVPLPRPSVFRDSRQVATFVLIPLLAAAVVVAILWQARRPDRLTAGFNVAVAGVKAAETASAAERDAATRVQQRMVDLLARELNATHLASVAVGAERMPVVSDEPGAARLARAVNAQLVIYGDANMTADGRLHYSPSFYVKPTAATTGNVDELSGEHQLDDFITFDPDELYDDRPAIGQTADGAALIAHFVQALAYLSADDLARARFAIDEATQRSQAYVADYGPFDGREVLYLFAGHIARLQAGGAGLSPEQRDAFLVEAQGYNDMAVGLNSEYGRALIGRANVYYDQDELGLARHWYLAAAGLPKQPPDALIGPKAALGLGNVDLSHLSRRREGQGVPCEADTRGLADRGLASYGAVIAAQAAAPAEKRLTALAAQARLGRGQIAYVCADWAVAEEEFRAALRLRPDRALADEARQWLAIVKQRRD